MSPRNQKQPKARDYHSSALDGGQITVRDPVREKLSDDTEAFLACGGHIARIDSGISAYDTSGEI